MKYSIMGFNQEKAVELIDQDPTVEIRAFAGYSGWTHGQLEDELKQDTWLVSPVRNLVFSERSPNMWRAIISKIRPELLFLADSPDDLSEN